MFDGRDPIYLQIADQIRDDIVSGALAEEEQVMSTTQYATTYRINPATAAKAFAQLVDEGVVHKRRGVGIFVSPAPASSGWPGVGTGSSPTSSSPWPRRPACSASRWRTSSPGCGASTGRTAP